MISEVVRSTYKLTVGIECHVQLKTKTKLFSAVSNDAREAPPNTLVNHIDFGLPGALPVLNKEALYLASRAAFALNSKPQIFSKFDRKHYFYPDLPMGYQITQFDEPIILGGSVAIEVDGKPKTIGITRAHLEADAGKSTHPAGKDYSLVDLNRAGTPLLEIVSEPDMHTAAEAKAYAHELYLLMRYADVSDCNLYYGNMRFDVNVSVSQTETLGTRTETKNINSFRAVEKTIEYEVTRQIERLEKSQPIIQETRGWDDAKQRTFSQRTKENADDYRYMPDPDIPPVVLDDEYITNVQAEMPIMPPVWRQKLQPLAVKSSMVETLLDAEVETEGAQFLYFIEDRMNDVKQAKYLVNWYVNTLVPLIREEKFSYDAHSFEVATTIYAMVQASKLSSTSAKQLFEVFVQKDGWQNDNIEIFATDQGFIQISDTAEITKVVDDVITANPQAAEDVRNGEMKAIGFLVGQVMKLSKGKANPSIAQDLLKKQLNS